MSALVTLQQVHVCLLTHMFACVGAHKLDLLNVVCISVGRQGKTDELTFCQQLLMNEEVGLVPKEAKPTMRAGYYKALTLKTMQIAIHALLLT